MKLCQLKGVFGPLTALSQYSLLPQVISRAARKLSHASCTYNDVNIVNRHEMQTQLQTRRMDGGDMQYTRLIKFKKI